MRILLTIAIGLGFAFACEAQVPRSVLDAELVLAARNGNVDEVGRLLERGADAAAADKFGQPAILLACRKTYNDAHLKIIDLLLKHGAEIDSANRFGTTPLMITQTPSRYSNWDDFFKERGADFGKKDVFGGDYQSYPLFGAVEMFPPTVPPQQRKKIGERDIVWRLLIEGGLARLEDARCCGTLDDGVTVTMALAYYDYEYLFEKVVQKSGSVLLEKDGEGMTALHYAALGNCSSCIFLGFPGGDVIDLPDREGRSPIFHAAIRGHDEFIFRILKVGAETNIRDRKGNTPLGYAAAYGRSSAVMALLAGGADSATAAFEGAPALVAAAKAGYEDVVGMIVSLKVTALFGLEKKDLKQDEAERFRKLSEIDADQKGPDGRTALMHAAASGSLKMAAFLLAAGADPSLKDRDGRTAADIAREAGHTEFTRYLEEAAKKRITLTT